MRRLLLILLATIPLTGCRFFNPDGKTVLDVVESVESGEALDGPPSIPKIGGKDPAKAGSEAFKDPTVPAAKAQANGGSVSTDLIRSTDPAARSRAIARSRVDPFASLPIPPTPEITVVPVAAAGNSASNSGGSAAARASGSARPRSTSRPVAARPAPTRPPVRVQPPNRPLVLPSPIAALPTIPQPVIAPTISVSGVIQMGNEPYAIVRSGSEPERYVRVGDRIAGGNVRVKRIETLAFEPRVILEENGIEVSRPITTGSSGGGGAAGSSDGSSAPAPDALPVPAANVPRAQAALPSMPTALPRPNSLLQPAAGSVPDSLLLQPAEEAFQAILPNFQVPVPDIG